MIYKKVWYSKKEVQGLFKTYPTYEYTGYFLLGIIPLFIKREDYA